MSEETEFERWYTSNPPWSLEVPPSEKTMARAAWMFQQARIDELQKKADRMADMLQKVYVIFEREGKESQGEYRAQCAFICVEIDARIKEYKEAQIEIPQKEKDNWMETARRHCTNEFYYRGLIEKIGKLFGEKAYICDSGERSEDVLNAKVPELVEALVKAARNVFTSSTPKEGGIICYVYNSEMNDLLKSLGQPEEPK